jgi:hypothetical protein
MPTKFERKCIYCGCETNLRTSDWRINKKFHVTKVLCPACTLAFNQIVTKIDDDIMKYATKRYNTLEREEIIRIQMLKRQMKLFEK